MTTAALSRSPKPLPAAPRTERNGTALLLEGCLPPDHLRGPVSGTPGDRHEDRPDPSPVATVHCRQRCARRRGRGRVRRAAQPPTPRGLHSSAGAGWAAEGKLGGTGGIGWHPRRSAGGRWKRERRRERWLGVQRGGGGRPIENAAAGWTASVKPSCATAGLEINSTTLASEQLAYR